MISTEELEDFAKEFGMEDFMGTAAQMVMEQGRVEGRAEGEALGIAKGRAEGRAEGEIRSLMLLLELKFGTVPDEARERIANATLEQLDRWLKRVLEAENLGAVFGD